MGKPRLPMEAAARLREHKVVNSKKWYRRPKAKARALREMREAA